MNEARAGPLWKTLTENILQTQPADKQVQRFGEHQKPAANFMNVSNYICKHSFVD